jgi:acetyl-CoA carboxylase biotin carboxyl carrier protein
MEITNSAPSDELIGRMLPGETKEEWDASSVEEVRAELPGIVSQVLVSIGEMISVGETLLVLESMKMEIPVLSEIGGRIAFISISAGSMIREGDLLAIVEPTVNI